MHITLENRIQEINKIKDEINVNEGKIKEEEDGIRTFEKEFR